MSLLPYGLMQGHPARVQRGAALVELSFVMPVLILILIGITSIGRMLAQVAWMSQTGYLVMLRGAEISNPTARGPAMDFRFTRLRDGNSELAPVNAGNVYALSYSTSESITSAGGTEIDTISVRVTGALDTIIGPLSSLPISVEVSGAILALEATDVAGLSDFSNPAAGFDCNGNQLPAGSPPPSSCCSCVGTGCTCSGDLFA